MTKSYYAVIPATVRYDKKICPNAKLLYGEITALCNEKGFCWASNRYFAELYSVSIVSVSKWINSLIENGYLRCNFRYKEGTKAIEERCLSISDKFNTPLTNVNEGIKEKFKAPLKEKFKDNNTSINTTFNIKERKKESTYDTLISAYTQDSKLREAIYEYIKMRKLIKKPLTDRALELAFMKLDKLSKSNDEKVLILEQSITNSWQGLFSIKPEQDFNLNQKPKQTLRDL